MIRGLIALALSANVAAVGTANANDDPDVLQHPAPALHPQTTGCVTIHGKSTLSDWPYVSRICIGDIARRRTLRVLQSLICITRTSDLKKRWKIWNGANASSAVKILTA